MILQESSKCSPRDHKNQHHDDNESPAPLAGVELVNAEADRGKAVSLRDHADRIGCDLRRGLRAQKT